MLVDGKKEVAMFGEKIQVKARVHTLGGFSAHAGQKDLLAWFEDDCSQQAEGGADSRRR